MPVVRLEICGQVQGVGYRHWLKCEAEGLALTGWVRNLPDGRVEAELCGDRKQIEECLRLCHKGPASSAVTSVQCEETSQQRETSIKGFKILY